MAQTYRAADWDRYRMDYRNPHRVLEPPEEEISVVAGALVVLREEGLLPRVDYNEARFLEFRRAVAEEFEIPWTAITPRMQRLIWAINAITQPQVMIAAGVFCGNTFISNAGAGAGPAAVYRAKELVGVEIKPDEAARAERNVRRIDPTGVARVIADDAVSVVERHPGPIDLLYLDADGAGGRGKGVYLDILERAFDKMPQGSIVLAHNSVNLAEQLRFYLEFARDSGNMRASVNVIVDTEGLEVSCK